MRQIFVFTAANEAAQDNLKRTIQNPRPFAQAERILGAVAVEELKASAPEVDGFYAWGAQPTEKNPGTWKSLKEGDVVLTYFERGFHYVSTLLAKVHSPELAEELWGLDDETGKTWEYMYFLSQPKAVNLPLSDSRVQGLIGKKYQGFTRMGTKKLFAKYGSAEGFITEVLDFALPLDREALAIAKAERAEEDARDSGSEDVPLSLDDERARVMREIVRRRGQPKFRKALLQAYEQQCAVTGCGIEAILEAAHIAPYRNAHSNQVQNGLLLRADIHTLFDLGKLRVTVDYVIDLDEALRGSDYWRYQGKKLRLPRSEAAHPSPQALEIKLGLLADV